MTVNENDLSGTVFTGVSPDPTGAGIAVGDAVIQQPSVAVTAVNGAPLPSFDLIANLSNHIYYGSFTSNSIYLTKVKRQSVVSAPFPAPAK